MSTTPSENPGTVMPGTGQTEKAEDRNEATAPDNSTALDPESPLVTSDPPPEQPVG